jgi:hypothetical protein
LEDQQKKIKDREKKLKGVGVGQTNGNETGKLVYAGNQMRSLN